ncbi:uncharacterized protein LOC106661783 isoform X2 [Cimex lectularius]|uniref:Protein MRVI1 n=1 Tax=Cimex lectularius TaxID=79782 RepID=A0A8I6RCY7_CIMLE|nr:uncharacterized protein LOC106661783 isoform X2 [Cimex lectularius]
MGNCLSGCTARTPSQNGGDTVISYAGGKFYQTRKESAPVLDAKTQGLGERQVKEYTIVQKELEALKSQITHSQAVLASLKFTFLEAPSTVRSSDKVHRTTQTLQDSQPKSLENVSTNRERSKEWNQLTSSCPALVHNIAIQTEFVDIVKNNLVNDAEYFLPPIGTSIDVKGVKEPKSVEAPTSIDLDIYRSCRKLSVLPEEECVLEDSPPGSRLLPKFPEQQAHSFESYLLPTSSSSAHVMRQLSDPTTSRSTRRPLQVSSSSSTAPKVQDSGLGSEVRIASPTFTTLQDTLTQLVNISFASDQEGDLSLKMPVTPLSPETPFKTGADVTPNSPNRNSSSDTSLSFQTPTEISPGNESPIGISTNDKITEPRREKESVTVLVDDKPLILEPAKDSLAPGPTELSRVPSKRRLVRSLARISSEMPLDLPYDGPETSTSEPFGNGAEVNELTDSKLEMEQNQSVFPNLSDSALRQLGLWMQSNTEEKEAGPAEEDIEHKYTSLVLAFKTDKLTLSRRLELQHKLRDQAEINMTHEVDALKSAIQSLNDICTDGEKSDLFNKVSQQVETLYSSAIRVSSTSELYGAVQQENRLSKAVDVVLKHVENLKQMYEKEKNEHEEMKKLMKDNNKTPQNLTVSSLKNDGKRRASIATLHQGQNLTEQSNTTADRRGSSSRRGSHIRRSGFAKTEPQGDHCKTNDNGQMNKLCKQGRCSSNNNHLLATEEQQYSGDSHLNSSEGETDTDDELGYEHSEVRQDAEVQKKLPQKYKFRKRSSFCAPPWMLKLMGYLEWLQPYENYALQARYFIAGVFVFFAIAIVSSSFFVTPDL